MICYPHNANGTLESRFSLPQPQPYKLPAQEFTYDDDNRIASGSYQYDDDGNLLQRTEDGSQTTAYQYDARSRGQSA